MKRLTLVGLAFLLMVFLSAKNLWAETREYRIATVGWAGWSPLHVAQEKGFWQKQGIRVRVVDYDDPIIVLEAIHAGRIDFAMDMVGTLVGLYETGEQVVALMETDWSNGGDKIILKRGVHFRDIKGQRVGVFLNQPSCLFFLGQYLDTLGLQPSDFDIVEINPDDLSDHFLAGRLSAIVNYDPWTLKAIQGGEGQVVATSADFPGAIPECIWTYQSVLESIPAQDVVKILRGWLEAVVWIQDPSHWAAYSEILSHKTYQGLFDLSSTELEVLFGNVAIHSPARLRDRNRTGGGGDRFLENLRDFLSKNGLLRRDFTPRDIFDNRFAVQAISGFLDSAGSDNDGLR